MDEMNDRQLLTALKASNDKRLQEVLWKRYENLVHKNWAILRRQMDNSALVLNARDDFYSESFIAFRKAVDAIDLSKIYDDKWKFIGYFRFYLKNVRADMIENIVKTYHHEKSFYVETSDGDELARIDGMPEIIEREGTRFDPVAITERGEAEAKCANAVAKCMSRWDDKRRQIFRWREQGISKSNIAKKLSVHPATITYHLSVMKADIRNILNSSH